MDKNRGKAELFLILITIIWGGTFAVTKEGMNGASPLLFLGIRFFTAWIVYTLINPRVLLRFNRQNLRDGLILGLFMFLGYGLQNISLVHTSASRTGFITYSFALYVPFLQLVILKQKPHRGNVVGLILVVVGMVLIAGPMGGSLNLGDLVSLISAVCFALYIISLDQTAKRSDPAVLTSLQFLLTSAGAFAAAFLFEDIAFTPSARLFGSIAYLSVLGSVVAVSVMTRFQKELTPTKAVLIYALEPVFAVIIAVLIFRESFTLREALGCTVILGGVVLSELWQIIFRNRRPVKAT